MLFMKSEFASYHSPRSLSLSKGEGESASPRRAGGGSSAGGTLPEGKVEPSSERCFRMNSVLSGSVRGEPLWSLGLRCLELALS